MSDHEKPEERSVTRRGQILKEAREAKGLSLDTVHEMSKIPLDVLHAIEEGYTVRMVSTYYFKGFIKMYANYLGVDPKLVLDQPTPTQRKFAKVPEAEKKDEAKAVKFNEFLGRQNKKQMMFWGVMSGIAIFVIMVIWLVWHHSATSEKRVESPVVKKLQVKEVAPVVVEEKKSTANVKVKSKEVKKDESRSVAKPKPVASTAREVRAAESTTSKSKDQKVKMTIRSRVTGWIQVKVDGVVVFQSTMREGTTETWQANQSIELSGKNISNLEFEVNGKVIGQLGKADRGARRVIVTSEGLDVKQ